MLLKKRSFNPYTLCFRHHYTKPSQTDFGLCLIFYTYNQKKTLKLRCVQYNWGIYNTWATNRKNRVLWNKFRKLQDCTLCSLENRGKMSWLVIHTYTIFQINVLKFQNSFYPTVFISKKRKAKLSLQYFVPFSCLNNDHIVEFPSWVVWKCLDSIIPTQKSNN
jgi:hypothetical protein